MLNRPVYEHAMREALLLADKGRFTTAPNPCVGAVLIRDGRVVAGGYHGCCGGPHAEICALADVRAKGIDPAECALAVTLEPCCHVGRTPPCTEAVLEAGIRTVIIGAMDPNPLACGGAARLRDAGVTVHCGVLERDCLDSIADFITWQTTNLPYTVLKLAATLDGRIATRAGNSRWISCEESRGLVHDLRRHAGAVLIGGNTFYHDNPQLTCRPGPGEEPARRQPLAVVVTSRLPSPDMPGHLLQERPGETIFWTTIAAAASPKAEALRKMGVSVLGLPPLPKTPGAHAGAHARAHEGVRAELDLSQGLTTLRNDYGCYYVLCEGGGRLALSLLEKNLAGEMRLHLAPRILADNEATPLFTGLSPLQVEEGLSLRVTGTAMCGGDVIITLRPGCPRPETSNCEDQ